MKKTDIDDIVVKLVEKLGGKAYKEALANQKECLKKLNKALTDTHRKSAKIKRDYTFKDFYI